MNKRVFGDEFVNNIIKLIQVKGYNVQNLSDNELNVLINKIMNNIYEEYSNNIENLSSLGYNVDEMNTEEVINKIIEYNNENPLV